MYAWSARGRSRDDGRCTAAQLQRHTNVPAVSAGFMQDVALMDDDIRQLNNVNRSFHKLLAEEHAMRIRVDRLSDEEAVSDADKRAAARKLASASKKVR